MQDLPTKVLDGTVVHDPAGLRAQSDEEVVARRQGSGAVGRGQRRCFSCSSCAAGMYGGPVISGCGKGLDRSGIPTPTPTPTPSNSTTSATRTALPLGPDLHRVSCRALRGPRKASSPAGPPERLQAAALSAR